MANPTTNFGWVMPTSTDLVTDLPADFNVFGQGVDTSLQYLLGGTTGQVLSKTSNTNMAFTWVAQDDSNAIQNAIVDAKGDIIAATAADTPARLAVGANDTVLTADSTAATGLKWATAAAGGMTQIASGTVTAGTMSISSIVGTYNHLQLWLYNFDPGASAASPAFRVNDDTSTNYPLSDTALYYQSNAGNNGYWALNLDNEESEATAQIIMNIYNYASSSDNKIVTFNSAGKSNADNTKATIGFYYGSYKSSSAITKITTPFNNQGGTAMSFNYKLYGVK